MTCPRCGGTGVYTRWYYDPASDEMYRGYTGKCLRCNGTGELPAQRQEAKP